jgi:hypothetical protein
MVMIEWYSAQLMVPVAVVNDVEIVLLLLLSMCRGHRW